METTTSAGERNETQSRRSSFRKEAVLKSLEQVFARGKMNQEEFNTRKAQLDTATKEQLVQYQKDFRKQLTDDAASKNQSLDTYVEPEVMKNLFSEPEETQQTSTVNTAPAEGGTSTSPQKAPEGTPTKQVKFDGGAKRRSKSPVNHDRDNIGSDTDGDEPMSDGATSETTQKKSSKGGRLRKRNFVINEAEEGNSLSEDELLAEITAKFEEEEEETYANLCDECGELTKVDGFDLCSPCKRKSIRRIASKERANKNRKERHLKMLARDQAKRKKQVEIARKYGKQIDAYEKAIKEYK